MPEQLSEHKPTNTPSILAEAEIPISTSKINNKLEAVDGKPLTPARIVALQRVIGNQGVMRLWRAQENGPVQRAAVDNVDGNSPHSPVIDQEQNNTQANSVEEANPDTVTSQAPESTIKETPFGANQGTPSPSSTTNTPASTSRPTRETPTDENETEEEQPAHEVKMESVAAADTPPAAPPATPPATPPADAPPNSAVPPENPQPVDASQVQEQQNSGIDAQMTEVEVTAREGQDAVQEQLAQAAADPLPSITELIDNPEGLPVFPRAVQTPVAGSEPVVSFDPQPVLSELPALPQPQAPAFDRAALSITALPTSQSASTGSANAPTLPSGITAPAVPDAPAPAGVAAPKIPDLTAPELNQEAVTGLVQRTPDDGGDDYNPITAREQVKGMATVLMRAPTQAAASLKAQALSVRVQLVAQATLVKTSLKTQFSGSITRIQTHFTRQRAQLTAAILAAQTQINTTLTLKIAEANARGTQAKTDLAAIVNDKKALAQTAINNATTAVEEMRTQQKNDASRRLGEKADEARRRGTTKANSYPSDERGGKQAAAVKKVADETATEIGNQVSGFHQGIDDLLVDFPSEIQTQGNELLAGFDNVIPELDAKVDETIQVVVTTLESQANDLSIQLASTSQSLAESIDSAEMAAIAGVQTQLPIMVAQIDSLVSAVGTALSGGVDQATGEISTFAQQSHATLVAIETPDVDKAQSFIDQVLAFVQSTPGELGALFQELSGQAGQQFTQVSTQSQTVLQETETTLSTELKTANEGLVNAFSQMGDTVSTGFDTILLGLDTPFNEAETQVETNLSQGITDFETGFNTTLSNTNTEVTNAVDSGFIEIDNAISQMEGKMNEAADDAAWRHDHPILAAIGDGLSFIGGLIVGLVAAIALAVVAIVVATAAIALLVALGVSSAVATAIVIIAGVALLAYGVYQGYTSRVARGESGINALLGGFADVLGITSIINGINRIRSNGHVDFWSGFEIGFGVGTLGTLIFGNRLTKAVRARMPARLTNPVRGSLLNRGRNSTQNTTTKAPVVGDEASVKTEEPTQPQEPVVAVPDRAPVLSRIRDVQSQAVQARTRFAQTAGDTNVGSQLDALEAQLAELLQRATNATTADELALIDRQITGLNRQIYTLNISIGQLELQPSINAQQQRINQARAQLTQIEGQRGNGGLRDRIAELKAILDTAEQALNDVRNQVDNAGSEPALDRARTRLNEIQSQIDNVMSSPMVSELGIREDAAKAIQTLERVKYDPVGDINSGTNHNHYRAARQEALNQPLDLRRPDGSPYSHIRDLQNARLALKNVLIDLQNEANNMLPTITERGMDTLIARISETQALINRLDGFLNEIGWPALPSRLHRWIQQPDGTWIGVADTRR